MSRSAADKCPTCGRYPQRQIADLIVQGGLGPARRHRAPGLDTPTGGDAPSTGNAARSRRRRSGRRSGRLQPCLHQSLLLAAARAGLVTTTCRKNLDGHRRAYVAWKWKER